MANDNALIELRNGIVLRLDVEWDGIEQEWDVCVSIRSGEVGTSGYLCNTMCCLVDNSKVMLSVFYCTKLASSTPRSKFHSAHCGGVAAIFNYAN